MSSSHSVWKQEVGYSPPRRPVTHNAAERNMMLSGAGLRTGPSKSPAGPCWHDLCLRFNAPFDIRCRQLRRPLRFRRPVNEKLGNGGDKLRWRERLLQKDSVRNTMRGPLVGASTCHIDDREFRIDFSGVPGDFPAVHSAPQLYVRHNIAFSVTKSFVGTLAATLVAQGK